MAIHDPTSIDKQGHDEGSQYRSVIIAKDKEEELKVQEFISDLDASGIYDAPIVTQVLVAQRFRVAESYHQDFYTNNPSKPYCQLVVKPKLEKVIKLISSQTK